MTCVGPSRKHEEDRGLLNNIEQAGSLRTKRSYTPVKLLLTRAQSLFCRPAFPVGNCRGRDILAYGDNAGDLSVRLEDGTIVVVKIGLFQLPIPQNWDQGILVRHCLPIVKDGFELSSDDRPNIRPEITTARTQGVRMPIGQDGPEGIVVKEDQFRAAEEQDRIARGEHHVHRTEQRFSPHGDRSDRGRLPINARTLSVISPAPMRRRV